LTITFNTGEGPDAPAFVTTRNRLPSALTSYPNAQEAGGWAACASNNGWGFEGFKATFVIGEMAMAFVLLIGAGLMARTLLQLWRVDPGFDPHHVVTFSIHPAPSLADQSPDGIRAFIRQLGSSMHSIPGAEYVSIERGAQLMESDNETAFWVEGHTPPARQADLPLPLEYFVEPEYLKVMRIPFCAAASSPIRTTSTPRGWW
jgi:hypothetical protein